jgi:hypothetical protein
MRPLTDATLPAAEQDGMSNLFTGAIALYKNPQRHRNVPTEAIDAAEVIVFASYLVHTVDQFSPPSGIHCPQNEPSPDKLITGQTRFAMSDSYSIGLRGFFPVGEDS